MGNIKIRNLTLLLYVVVIFLMIAGISYAYNPGSANANIATGMYGINETIYGSTTFSSANLKFTPILDNELEESEDNVIKIDFNVMGAQNNPTDKPIIYDIALTDLDIDCELLNGKYLRWRLDKNGETIVGGAEDERSFSIKEDNIVNGRYLLTQIQQDLIAYNTDNNYDSYTLYIWLSDICQNEDISTCDTSTDTFKEQQKLIGKSITGKVEVQLYTESKKAHEKNTLPEGSDACSNVLYAFLRNTEELEIDSIQIETGKKFGFLPTPTKNGFTFNGWYSEEDFRADSLVTSDTIVTTTKNIELFARWKPDIYDLVYNLNGGIPGTIAPVTANYDKAVRISNPTKSIKLIGSNQGDSRIVIGNNPVTANFTFDGWTSEDLYTAYAKYGSSEGNITTAWSDGSTKVKAEYFKNLYYHEDNRGSVTLTANWKTASTDLPTITSNIPGYSVCKWYEDGTGTLYNSGESYTPALTSGDVNFYAQCNNPNTYNISYDLNDSKASLGSKAPTTATYDKVVEIDNPSNYYVITLNDNGQNATIETTTVNASRKFEGWTFDGDTSTAKYSNTSNNVNGPWNNNNTKINAKYFKNLTGTNNATVTLTANWGTGNQITLPTVTKTDYICNWNTRADGSGTEIAGNGTGIYTPTGNDTIYAICKPGYNISYDLVNGTAGTNMPSSAIFDESIIVSHPTKNFSLTCNAGSTGASVTNPNSTSYTFSGWSGTNIDTSTAKWGSTSNPSTSWTGTTPVKGTNNLTYFKNLTTQGGSTVVMTANWTAPTVTAPTITKLGYGCSCKNGSTVISGNYTPSSNGPTSLTLTGSCSANTYNITYNLNGGTAGTYAPTSATYDQDVRISEPTKTYTVQFNANSQSATISSTTSKTATAGFTGWQGSNVNSNTAKRGTASNPTTSWNGSTIVKGSYFKNLNPTNGATVTMEAIWGNATNSITLPTVTRQNYTCGWTTSSSANNIAYNSGATYTPTDNVTLYAKCMANISNYSIEHYVMNTGGEYEKLLTENQSGNSGTSVNLESYKKTTSKYNVTNGIYFAGGTVEDEAVESVNIYDGMVIKLYYNRTYGYLTTKAGDNISSVTTSNSKKYYYESTVPTLTANLASATGYTYTFSKWTSSNTTYISDKTANPTGTFTWPAMPDGTNITLTASATKSAIKYTIAYETNGGVKGSSAPTSGTYDSSVKISNPSRSATVTFNANSQNATISSSSKIYSMTFQGWTATSGLNTDTAYYSSNNMDWTRWTSATNKITNASGKEVYFKNLRSASGTVTLKANWPSGFPSGPTSTITKENHTCGWATSSSGTIVYASGANYTPTKDVTLYAKCNPNTYTITYNTSNCNSSAATTAQVNQGSTLGTLPNVSTTNKVFNGWYTSSSGGNQISASTIPTGNTTYYAQCTTAYYQNTNTSSYHVTLADAISEASAGNTIQLLSNYTDTSSVTFNKNLTFDTNGKTLTRKVKMIINSGVTVTKNGSGTITTSEGSIFNVSGNLNLNAGVLNQTGNYINVYNTGSGTITVAGATLNSSASGSAVIKNESTGKIVVSSGTLSGTDYRGITNAGGGSISITGGVVKAADAITIYNSGSGSVSITGGTVGAGTADILNISNEGTGSVSITGGTIKCTSSDSSTSCIRNISSGTLTVKGVTVSGGGRILYNGDTGKIIVGDSGNNASDGATSITTTSTQYSALTCGNVNSDTKCQCYVYDGAYLKSAGYTVGLHGGDYRQYQGSMVESTGTSAKHAALYNVSDSYSSSGYYGRVFIRRGVAKGAMNGIYSTTPSSYGVAVGSSDDTLYTTFSTSPNRSANGPTVLGTNSSSGRGVNIQSSGNYWRLSNGTVGGNYAPSNINQSNVSGARSGYKANVGSGTYNYYFLEAS